MKSFILFFISMALLHNASSLIHFLKTLNTASAGLRFVTVVLVDGVQVFSYDGHVGTVVQDWVKRLTEENPHHWDWQIQSFEDTQMLFSDVNGNSEQTCGQRSEGATTDICQIQTRARVLQQMVGCEWDNETNQERGFLKFGIDGEDFLIFDVDTKAWTAAKQEVGTTKERLNQQTAHNNYWRRYLTRICPWWLKKLVQDGGSSLRRTERPLLSLLQKSSSVTCHATGFFPNRAALFWTKDVEKVLERVNPGDILPNNDGSFQMRVDLDMSSVPPEDWSRYKCVFQMSGVQDVVSRLEQLSTGWSYMTIIFSTVKWVLIVVAAVAVLVGVISVLWIWSFLHKSRSFAAEVISEVLGQIICYFVKRDMIPK